MHHLQTPLRPPATLSWPMRPQDDSWEPAANVGELLPDWEQHKALRQGAFEGDETWLEAEPEAATPGA